jgi:hypothetical protein
VVVDAGGSEPVEDEFGVVSEINIESARPLTWSAYIQLIRIKPSEWGHLNSQSILCCGRIFCLGI